MAKSATHKFGQIIGELLEETLIQAIRPIAAKYDLFLDYKHPRLARNKKREVIWKDIDGNDHKLDIVLEEGGSETVAGTPRAFIEIAWRRYTKHSKNKVQEISGAVVPLFSKYRKHSPFIGVVLAGEFTGASITQLESEGFSVVYFKYSTIIAAFASVGIDAKWEENTPENEINKKITKETLNNSRY
mgnify:CR=1 FL=1